MKNCNVKKCKAACCGVVLIPNEVLHECSNLIQREITQQVARIAELEKRAEARKLANRVLKHKQKELKAKLNQWRKVLKEIAESNNGVDEDGLSCFFCDHMIYIAQKALKGAGDE